MMESFDGYSGQTTEWKRDGIVEGPGGYWATSSWGTLVAEARTGTYCYDCYPNIIANNSNHSRFTFNESYDTLIFGYGVKFDSVAAVMYMMTLVYDTVVAPTTSAQCTLRINAEQKIEVRRGQDTIIAVGTTSMVAQTWYQMEIKVTIHETNGAIEIRLNGNEEMQLTGLNTKKSPSEVGIKGFYIQGNNIDDLVVMDTTGDKNNDFLGWARVYHSKPISDGTYGPSANPSDVGWIPDTGVDGYAVIDESPPSASSYIESDSYNSQITFNMDPLPLTANILTVEAVEIDYHVIMADPFAKMMTPLLYNGGELVGGDVIPLVEVAKRIRYIYETNLALGNPSVGEDWTIANFNSTEFGIEDTAF